MNPLTIVYATSRRDPKIEWFFDSLSKQVKRGDKIDIVVVDHFANEEGHAKKTMERFLKAFQMCPGEIPKVTISNPKPTIWQGEHRITKEDWWAKSNALNTGICLCKTDYIAFVDDRCVLAPTWLDAVEEAMRDGYATCGSYEKRHNLKVEQGVVVDPGTDIGGDTRPQDRGVIRMRDWYGSSGVLQLEWCLRVNGFSEDVCDSLGMEDSVFGINLRNNGCAVYYDPRMKIIEDRTPGEIDGALKRTDWGISPDDASHAVLEKFKEQKTSLNSFDIRKVRDAVLAGKPFPSPSASHTHWFSEENIPTKFNAIQ